MSSDSASYTLPRGFDDDSNNISDDSWLVWCALFKDKEDDEDDEDDDEDDEDDEDDMGEAFQVLIAGG